MNVCHITSIHSSNDTRIFLKQCSTLITKGVEVTLIAPHDKDEVINGVTIKALKNRSSAITRILFSFPKILFFSLNNKYDIYHAHDPELVPVLFILKIIGRKVIYDMHENFPKQIESKDLPKMLKALVSVIWPRIEYIAFRRIGVVFAETSYKEDYVYVKNSVDVLNMPLIKKIKKIKTVKNDRFTLGYVGGVSENRYCLRILETLKRLQISGVDIGFECVGPIYSESTKVKINRLCSNLNNVNFYGRLSPVEAWEKMKKCHIGIAVLMPEPNYINSYPTKLFEYLAMDIPVITSNFELYKDVVTTNNVGFCVDPVEPVEFDSAVLELYNNKKLLNKMSNNASMITIDKFNWDNELEKLFRFYESLVDTI